MTSRVIRFAFDRKPIVHDAIAFDRASARTKDADGVMHVARSHISKANICPYTGQEIMQGALNGDSLKLDPNKVYHLLRDPEELAKAASTFNNKPLLRRHVPHHAESYDPNDVVGSIGSDCVFSDPYLDASLSIWNADAIAGVEDGSQREISCSYRYNADMTPGSINGVAFSGRMLDIVANHVALVEAGRAGPDVMVHDQKPEKFKMAKGLMSRTAVRTHGALTVYLASRLADDAKLPLAPIVKGLTAKNFDKQKSLLAGKITKAVEGKLAKDADIADLMDVIEAIKGDDDEVSMDEDPEADMSMDSDGLKDFLKGKLSDEDHEKACAMMGGKSADEDMDDKDENKKDKDDKKANDAKIKTAVDGVEKRFRDLRDAERLVRPYVGEVALDSAAEILRFAIDSMEIDYKGDDIAAMTAIIKTQPIPGAEHVAKKPLAMDAKVTTKMQSLFGVGA